MASRLLTRFASPIMIIRNKSKEVAKDKKDEKVYQLWEFFDRPDNWGMKELSLSRRPGRSWTADELRLKSNSDLHKLWYVLLKERNMLLTMREAYKIRYMELPNPERIDRVKESMDNIEIVVHERNDAYLQLETGKSASPPKRKITSFAGFTYEVSANEHYGQPEVTGVKKEYEVPMLDDKAYLFQKLWKEKEHLKEQIRLQDEYLLEDPDRSENPELLRGLRRHFDRVEDLPEQVVARRRKEKQNIDKIQEEKAN
uniref:Large ribosomal subunit protein uL29m n=2 Tax=Meloidogyne TaxID=189290 RepID=A0A914N194_MELIC